MPGDRLTHSCAMTQSAVLPGVKINTHGRRNIDDRVEFAVAAAFREPDRLKFGPLFRRWRSGEP
jgi:hypothetical protein